MKDTEKIMESAGESISYIKQATQQQLELIKLEAAERTAKAVSSMVTIAILLAVVSMVAIFGTITLALFLGEWLDSYEYAFLIITITYILLGALLYFFKKTMITNPVLSMVIQKFFKGK